MQSSDFINLKDQVQIVHCPSNPGYLGGVNEAQQRLKLNLQSYQWVLVSNSDLIIQNQSFYNELMSLKLGDQVGGVCPSVYSELQSKETGPLYLSRPSKNKIGFLKWIYSFYFLAWIYHAMALLRAYFHKADPLSIKEGDVVYAPHGCCFILNQNFFRNSGHLQHQTRLYGEEIMIAEQMRSLGLKIVYRPQFHIIHREMGSQGQHWSRALLSYQTFLFKRESSRYLSEIFK